MNSSTADLRRAAMLSLILLGGAAAALTLANYLAKGQQVAVSSGSDAGTLDDWLRKAASSLHQTRQRIVDNLDSSSDFGS